MYKIFSFFFLWNTVALAQSLNSGLIAYYPFTAGSLNDFSGNGHHGTNIGSTAAADMFGTASNARYFNGSSRISIPHTAMMRPSTMPVSMNMWVKIPVSASYSYNHVFYNSYDPTNYYGFQLTVNPGGYLYTGFGDGGAPQPGHRQSKVGWQTNISDGQWHMITAVIYGSANMDLWVDCTPEPGSYSGYGGAIAYPANMTTASIGACGGAQGILYTTGTLDEIRFYNRALTQADVNALYGLGTLTANLGPDQTTCSSVVLNPGTNTGATYLWSTGATSQTVTATTAGTYWVQVSKGCAVRTDTVVINMAPAPIANAGADKTVCQGVPVTLLSTGTSAGATYLWSTGATTATITTTIPGTYWVQTSNACGSTRDTVVVSHIAPPTANLGADKVLCAGATTVLQPTVTGSGSIGYLWSNGQTGPTASIATPGTYWVQVTASCGTARDTLIITGLPAPVLSLGPDKTLCATTATLVATGNAMQVQWAGPGIVSSNGMAAIVNQSGLYIVTGYSDNGCQSRDTVQLVLIASPIVDLGVDTTVCDSFVLDAGYPGSAYLWSTGATSRVVTYNASGTYWVQVTPQPGCSDRDTVHVTVVGTPVAHFTTTWLGGTTVQFLNASVHATQYVWEYEAPNGVYITDTTTHPLVTFPTPGSRYVVLTSSNVCGSDTLVYLLDWEKLTPTDPSAIRKIQVYPNPATESFRVTGLEMGILLMLTNSLGQTVWQGASCEALEVPVGNLVDGVYWLRAPGNALSAKVVVKR